MGPPVPLMRANEGRVANCLDPEMGTDGHSSSESEQTGRARRCSTYFAPCHVSRDMFQHGPVPRRRMCTGQRKLQRSGGQRGRRWAGPAVSRVHVSTSGAASSRGETGPRSAARNCRSECSRIRGCSKRRHPDFGGDRDGRRLTGENIGRGKALGALGAQGTCNIRTTAANAKVTVF